MMVNNKILEYNHDKVIVEENDDSPYKLLLLS